MLKAFNKISKNVPTVTQIHVGIIKNALTIKKEENKRKKSKNLDRKIRLQYRKKFHEISKR